MMGTWLAENDESWFSYKRMEQHRELKNPHFKAKKLRDDEYYLLSIDVG